MPTLHRQLSGLREISLRRPNGGANCGGMNARYDIRVHEGEKTRVHHTQGTYRLPPALNQATK
jgi:hypothetical protein